MIRDIIDLSMKENVNLGLLSTDQEKAFDRVDHEYVFKSLLAFGFGIFFNFMGKIVISQCVCLGEGARRAECSNSCKERNQARFPTLWSVIYHCYWAIIEENKGKPYMLHNTKSSQMPYNCSVSICRWHSIVFKWTININSLNNAWERMRKKCRFCIRSMGVWRVTSFTRRVNIGE